MIDVDYPYLCSTIGGLAGIPVRVYKHNQQIFYYSTVLLPTDPLTAFKSEVLSVSSHIGYFITPHFHYYGIVNSDDYKIVIGPAYQIRVNDQTLKEIAFQCDVPQEETDAFVSGMKRIIPMPLDSILQILCAMNYVMNGEKLGLGDILIYDSEQKNLKKTLEKERVGDNFYDDPARAFEKENIHNTLALEQTLVNFVRRGDTATLKKWVEGFPAIRGGVLATNQIRQYKNTFIVTATLISRAAIRGGMDVDDALSLSDAYIQKCELLNDVDRITNLQYRMVFDYTEHVEKLRRGTSPSKLVLDVANYVQHHLSEAITTEDIAKALFMNRSWLSVKFKSEAGVTLNDFILGEKTDEAKRLLCYTDKSIMAISAYLGFSSQSHFSRVFKKYANCLPAEYRKRYGESN